MTQKSAQTFISHCEKDTEEAAAVLAGKLAPATIILLRGDLGAGKSLFARALIRALCENPDLSVPSPTFTLVQSYDSCIGPVRHFDLYRLKDPCEIFELGWEEGLREGLTLVEWPERLGPYVPPRRLEVWFGTSENEPGLRHIEFREVTP